VTKSVITLCIVHNFGDVTFKRKSQKQNYRKNKKEEDCNSLYIDITSISFEIGGAFIDLTDSGEAFLYLQRIFILH